MDISDFTSETTSEIPNCRKSLTCGFQDNLWFSRMQFKLITVLILLFFTKGLFAQAFPVQVNQVWIPPYNTKLSSYATMTETKLRLQLLMTDVNEINRHVKLKFFIQGDGINAQSNDFVVGAKQIFLTGGSPIFYTSIDLRPYFEYNNLLGLSPQQYSRPLPDGIYKVCWQVFDAFSNKPLSLKTCQIIYLVLNDPPILNIPERGELIQEQNMPNIIFQWTPRHVNAGNASYKFELREIWDTQIDPRAAFLASPNYHSEQTYATTLLYNISKPTLIPGKTYAWRVKAISKTGLSENSVFKNNGYSEIYYFTYSSNCDVPSFILATPKSPQTVKIQWQGNAEHLGYKLQYRKISYTKETDKQLARREQKNAKREKKGKKAKEYVPKRVSYEWFEVKTPNSSALVGNLKGKTSYEFRVGSQCDLNGGYTYSALQQFTMPGKEESRNYTCGVKPDIYITNKTPLENLGVNESFTAGDFPVTVKSVKETGKGRYSGLGYIVVPYLADTKIAVEFNNISINTDYQLFDGVVESTYDPTWGNVVDVDEVEELMTDVISETSETVKYIVGEFKTSIENKTLAKIWIDQLEEVINDPENGYTEEQKQQFKDSSHVIKRKVEDLITEFREKVEKEGIPEELAEKFMVSGFNNPIPTIPLDKLVGYAKKKMAQLASNAVKSAGKIIVYYGKAFVEYKLDDIVDNSEDPLAISLALTTEFITGLGPEERKFDQNHPLTQSLMSSNMTTEALKAYYKGYVDYKNEERPLPPPNYQVDFSYLIGGNTGPFKEFFKDGEFTTAQFTGTANYIFDLNEEKEILNISVYDTKSEYSFLYHASGTDRHTRTEGKIMGETTQYYNFSISIDEIKNRVK